jgi:hypothetical protein
MVAAGDKEVIKMIESDFARSPAGQAITEGQQLEG